MNPRPNLIEQPAKNVIPPPLSNAESAGPVKVAKPITRNAVAALTKSLIMKNMKTSPIETQAKTMPHVSSGSIIINNLIGGSPTSDGKGSVCPGFPRRKITEIYGGESSGKTSLALSAVVQAQKAGGVVMYLDFEHSLHHGYAKQIGVTFDDTFLLYAPDTMEEGLKMMYIGIVAGVDLVVIDSVAAMVPGDELTKDINDTAKIGAVAKKLSENLPKFVGWLAKHPMEGKGEVKHSIKDHPGTAVILLNQERATIATGGYGVPEPNTAGGKALKYYAYARLRLSRTKTESIERKDPLTGKPKKFPYGNVTEVKMVKSKADAKQGHKGSIFIRYGYGVDDAISVIETGTALGIIKKEGSYLSFQNERIAGKDKFRALLLSNAPFYTALRTAVAKGILDSAPTAISDDELADDDDLVDDLEGFGGETTASAIEEETITED